jgi:hypothetical protein
MLDGPICFGQRFAIGSVSRVGSRSYFSLSQLHQTPAALCRSREVDAHGCACAESINLELKKCGLITFDAALRAVFEWSLVEA